MTERLRSLRISVEVDTNKDTYREDFENAGAFVRWWNERAEALGLPLIEPPPDF